MATGKKRSFLVTHPIFLTFLQGWIWKRFRWTSARALRDVTVLKACLKKAFFLMMDKSCSSHPISLPFSFFQSFFPCWSLDYFFLFSNLAFFFLFSNLAFYFVFFLPQSCMSVFTGISFELTLTIIYTVSPTPN